MMNAPPMPISARMAISSSGESASAEQSEPSAEDEQAEGQRALAAEAVAERAGGEQHAGEDEHVDVDDPLQLRGGGVEVALQRRQRDVEDRVVERRSRAATGRGRRASTSGGDRAGRLALRRTWRGAPLNRNETVPFCMSSDRTASQCETQRFRFDTRGGRTSAAAGAFDDLEVAAGEPPEGVQLVVVPAGGSARRRRTSPSRCRPRSARSA